MNTGIVKRFNRIKGYGFVAVDDSDKEAFVHFSEVQTEGYKELKEGQRIKFILAKGEKGDFATKVEILE